MHLRSHGSDVAEPVGRCIDAALSASAPFQRLPTVVPSSRGLIAQFPSARCRISQHQLLLLPSFATAAAVRSLARHSLFPHNSGSSPGCAVAAFLSEFFILNGLINRCALPCSNR